MSLTLEQRATSRPPGSAPSRLGLALAVICAAQLMVVLDATIVNIALPSMQRDLHFSATGLQWVINAYTLAFGGLLLLGGRAGDLLGRRRVFVAGILLFSVASLAGGLATDQTWLLVARVVQGIGAAIASPTALSLIATTFPEGASRNRAMGVYAAMSGSGAAIGLLAGGVLTDVASWRWVLFVNVPIGLAVAAVAPRVLRESEARPGRFDLPGALSVTGGMTLLVYGLSHAATAGWSNAVTIGSLGVALALLAAFVGIEARSRHALMPLHILADRNRSGAYLVVLCIGASLFAMFFFLTQFVQDILGYSPLRAGVAFLPVSAGIVVVAGLVSRVVGRVGPRPLIMIGTLTSAGALFWLSRLGVHATYLGTLLPAMLLLAAGMGLAFVPLTLAAVSRVRAQETGLASALLNSGQQVGGSLGLAVLVTVATTVTRNRLHDALGAAARTGAHLTSDPTGPHGVPLALAHQATTAGYTTAFEVAAAIAVGGFVIATLMIRNRRDPVAGGPAVG